MEEELHPDWISHKLEDEELSKELLQISEHLYHCYLLYHCYGNEI